MKKTINEEFDLPNPGEILLYVWVPDEHHWKRLPEDEVFRLGPRLAALTAYGFSVEPVTCLGEPLDPVVDRAAPATPCPANQETSAHRWRLGNTFRGFKIHCGCGEERSVVSAPMVKPEVSCAIVGFPHMVVSAHPENGIAASLTLQDDAALNESDPAVMRARIKATFEALGEAVWGNWRLRQDQKANG